MSTKPQDSVLFKADTTCYKDKEVIGFYSDTFHMCMGDERGHFITDISNDKRIQYEINKDTLKVSFDGGKTYNTPNFIKACVENMRGVE